MPPDQMLNGVDLDEVEARARRVKDDPLFSARLVSVFTATREPRLPSQYVEERIYEGFPEQQDENRIAAFHDSKWQEALSIVKSLDDERLREFGFRLIYFGCRSVLPDELRREVERALTDRLVDENNGGLTLQQALGETDALLSDGRSDSDGILADYRVYLIDRISRVSEFRSRHLITQ